MYVLQRHTEDYRVKKDILMSDLIRKKVQLEQKIGILVNEFNNSGETNGYYMHYFIKYKQTPFQEEQTGLFFKQPDSCWKDRADILEQKIMQLLESFSVENEVCVDFGFAYYPEPFVRRGIFGLPLPF